MKKEIKELLADELKNLALNFDLIADTKVDVVFPINHLWSVGFSKLSTETYDYILFALLNQKTNYVVREVFLLKAFNKDYGEYRYNLQCNQLFKGNVQDADCLENFNNLPFQELTVFLDSHLTETQQWILHHSLSRL